MLKSLLTRRMRGMTVGVLHEGEENDDQRSHQQNGTANNFDNRHGLKRSFIQIEWENHAKIRLYSIIPSAKKQAQFRIYPNQCSAVHSCANTAALETAACVCPSCKTTMVYCGSSAG